MKNIFEKAQGTGDIFMEELDLFTFPQWTGPWTHCLEEHMNPGPRLVTLTGTLTHKLLQLELWKCSFLLILLLRQAQSNRAREPDSLPVPRRDSQSC